RLGRSLSADVEIDEPSVSRRHALIVRQDGQTYLLDDGSRNGTWHNGIRVDRAVLNDGDTIDLGTARLSYVEVVETVTEDLQLIAAGVSSRGPPAGPWTGGRSAARDPHRAPAPPGRRGPRAGSPAPAKS